MAEPEASQYRVGLGPDELDAVRQRFLSDPLQMRGLIAESGLWGEDLTPVGTFTMDWNRPFYQGFYPELPDENVKDYRVLCRLDGQVWRGLQQAAGFARQDSNPDSTALHDVMGSIRPLIDGDALDSFTRHDRELAEESPRIRQRLEQGMPRDLRMFSGLILLRALDIEMGFNSRIQQAAFAMDALGLNVYERALMVQTYHAAIGAGR